MRLFFTFIVFLTLAPAYAPAHAADLSPQARGEVNTLIEQYLMENPEALAGALDNMRAHFEAQESNRMGAFLRDQHDVLYRNDRDFSLGKPDAPITIIEFFDYNCGYCKRSFGDLMRVVRENDEDVRLVFKELPILGDNSRLAAAAALTLATPQNFIAYHTRLMSARTALNRPAIVAALQAVGASDAAISAGQDDAAIQAHLDATYEIARTLDISGTPSFIINDKIYKGALSYDEFAAAIAEARQNLN